MNRFRTKKKAKEEVVPERPSIDVEEKSMPSFKSFRRPKKLQEEQKQEIDLSNALPPSDDFRTSLLMTGLSARFSMLREQDDPNTKIGKASDDSVLFPKRQSRMDFTFGGGLADIAEVESIRAPPSFSRMDSYISDDADSTKGSVMGRSRPTEGNNLFGGRQKIFKIPVGSAMDLAGGMGGRALYEDDVALSAFQKWRQNERQRRSFDGEDEKDDAPRSESPPPLGYNRKRETSSTTSSAPSLARNSTAATSVASQPTPSTKDWQSQSAAPTSTSSTPAPERSVARTRRLYEQSLTQDLHDQQSSAVSRIDTLSRQKTLGSRTPEFAQNSPSPTAQLFHDRFTERRQILTKASAPNLRSTSPPASASLPKAIDLAMNYSSTSVPETKPALAGTPPVSPPISETGDRPLLPIQPNDRGKATAMGVFQKPVQPYDESKYAERQRQLQQGRETPTTAARADSSLSVKADRFKTTTQDNGSKPKADLSIETRRPSAEPSATFPSATFLSDDSDESPVLRDCPAIPPVILQRPLDEDHPALRLSEDSSSINALRDGASAGDLPHHSSSGGTPRQPSPEDSPTLGPTAGLSGMVRQHLRSESGASSIYGLVPPAADLESEYPATSRDSDILDGVSPGSNPWDEPEWTIPQDNYGANGHSSGDQMYPSGLVNNFDRQDLSQDEEDDFAHQLANARRRVQERLTSYADSDTSRATSPQFPPEPTKEPPQPPSRANPLGIIKSKAVTDRSRDNNQPKAMKLLGLGGSSSELPPPDGKMSMDESRSRPQTAVDAEDPAETKDEEPMHPGLRAFRNARRELQRRKELETLARHNNKMDGDEEVSQMSPAREGFSSRQRSPSTDRRPPPVSYRQRAPSQASSQEGTRNGSRPPSSQERDRTSSEAGNGRSFSRPPMLKNPPSQFDEHSGQLGPSSSRQPFTRSPGMPPTRSPNMPPHLYGGNINNPAASSPNPYIGLPPSRGGYDTSSSAPSSMSPFNEGMGFPSPGPMSGTTTPQPAQRTSGTASPGRSRSSSTLDPSLRRVVSKSEISDPTFVMSTSRVPTVGLSQASEAMASDRSRSGSRSRAESGAGNAAPPVPPINPRRRRDESNPRGTSNGFAAGSRGSEVSDDGSASSGDMSLPATKLRGRFAGPPSRAGGMEERQILGGEGSRVRPAISETNSRIPVVVPPRGDRGNNPPFFATGPPATRAVMTANKSGPSSTGLPGGMI